MPTDNLRHVALDTPTLTNLLAGWRDGRPSMGLLALLPEAEKGQLPLLQAVCRELAIPLAGAIFPALVTAQGFISQGAWLFRSNRFPPSFLLDGISAPGGVAVERIAAAARQLLEQAPPGAGRPTLYLIFDGMIPNIATLLDGLYLELADRVAYAGVNAGSESFQPMPCLFDGERVVGDGVLGLLLPPPGVTVLEHGYEAPERILSATSTEGNRILSIDWRPAFEVYQELIRSEYGIDLTAENFYQYGVHFPFGILRANGEVVVRIPVALTEDGSLFCVGEVPENAMLVLLRAPVGDAGRCIGRLAERLGAANGPLAGRPLLGFYCAGRRMHLGEESLRELAALEADTGVSVLAGALSLGEIGSAQIGGYPMFHNATLVCTPWDEE